MTDRELIELILQKVTHIEKEFKEEFKQVRSEFKEEIGLARSEFKEDIRSLSSEIKEEFNLVKSQLKEPNSLLMAIRDRQDETDAKFDSLASNVHQLHGEVADIKKGQERQNKILESLALRSLEQETELRNLKRI